MAEGAKLCSLLGLEHAPSPIQLELQCLFVPHYLNLTVLNLDL